MLKYSDIYVVARRLHSGPIGYYSYLVFDTKHGQFCWGLIYDALYCRLETAQQLAEEYGGEVKSVYIGVEDIEGQ